MLVCYAAREAGSCATVTRIHAALRDREPAVSPDRALIESSCGTAIDSLSSRLPLRGVAVANTVRLLVMPMHANPMPFWRNGTGHGSMLRKGHT